MLRVKVWESDTAAVTYREIKDKGATESHGKVQGKTIQ